MPNRHDTDLPATFTGGRHPQVVAEARRFVASCLSGRLGELRENAELVTSELVTNVLVHTNSRVTVHVISTGDCLHVEVHDDCAVLPAGGILDRTASCGRGLVLVEQLTQRWGVTRVPGAGKSVWFELIAGMPAPGDELSVDDLLDMWDDVDDVGLPDLVPEPKVSEEAPRARSDGGERRVSVRVEDVPTHLLNSAKSHLDDLVRDLTLVTEAASIGDRQDDDLLTLGCRLGQLVLDLIDFRNEIRRQAVAATHRHEETLTLELELPASIRPRLIDYLDALDEADAFCAAGRLLMPPAPPEQVEFRRWKLHRIIDQLADPR